MGLTSVLLVAMMACGDGSSGGATSTPVSPTVDLSNPDGAGLRWVDLEGFVTSDTPGVPDMFHPLEIGMTQSEARAALATLQDARRPRPQEVELQGYRIIAVPVQANDEIGLTAIIELATDRLDQLDVSVPSDQALYALTQAWGAPKMETHPELGPVAVWTNPARALRVELSQAPDAGRSVLKIRSAPEPAAE